MADKSIKKRKAVPMGTGAIFLQDRKQNGPNQKPPLALQYNNQFNPNAENTLNEMKSIAQA